MAESDKNDNSKIRLTWKLEDLFSSDREWEIELEAVKEKIPEVTIYNGKISESPQIFLEALKVRDSLLIRHDKVFIYAGLRRDEDNSNSDCQEMVKKARIFSSFVYSCLSFIEQEITNLPFEKLMDYYRDEDGLAVYRHFIEEMQRKNEHAISPWDRRLLALSEANAATYADIYTRVCNAELEPVSIAAGDGEIISISKSNAMKYLDDKDRKIRKEAHRAILVPYIENRDLFASMLNAHVKKNKLYAKAGRFQSALEAALFADNIPSGIYDNALEITAKHLNLLHRYVGLKRKAMNLDEIYIYDMNVPLMPEKRAQISFGGAAKLVLDSLRPLGDEYIAQVEKGLNSGWVDVYPRQGKTSGNFSWGVYGTHPFVLLNFKDTISEAVNLVHELGHAMYNYLSSKNQPYVYSQPKIFVSEAAAFVNEILLINHLLSKAKDRGERIHLISLYINMYVADVFRSSMYAEFEKYIYQRLESGENLTGDTLCEIMKKLYAKYYGNELMLVEDAEMEWATVNLFFESFYVYKYVTGFAAAYELAGRILAGDREEASKYLEMLSMGDSDYPLNLLKIVNIDFTMTKPLENAMKGFESLLIELEGLLGEQTELK